MTTAQLVKSQICNQSREFNSCSLLSLLDYYPANYTAINNEWILPKLQN